MVGKNILIVDDEAPIREMIAVALEMAGYECLEAENTQQAHAIIVDRKPDLILLDWMLPGTSGIELARRLKRDELTGDIPIIMLTAKGEEDNKIQGLEVGADDYITKPFSTQEILDAIAARVSRLLPLRERIEQLLTDRQVQVSANGSHELMTSLTGVLGGLDLIEMEVDSIKLGELKELLGLVREGVERQFKLSRKLIRYFELEQKKHSSPKTATVGCSAADATTGNKRDWD